MTRELSVGLVGGGNFARTTILPAIERLDGLWLRSVATASGESAKSIATQYDCPHYTTDSTALLTDDAVDLVVIATRHNLHADLAVEALSADKDVHLEKPLSLTREDSIRLLRPNEPPPAGSWSAITGGSRARQEPSNATLRTVPRR
jgi:predicted dehydrogenase